MNELVALDFPREDRLAKEILNAWEDGDAVCVLDSRLPKSMAFTQLTHMAPTRVRSETESIGLPHGKKVQSGDAVVVLTSGTTGKPKSVVHSFSTLQASANATFAALDISSDDHWICALPPSHIGGLSVITRSLLTSTKLSIIDGFDPTLINELKRRGANLISIVGAVLSSFDLSQFKVVLLGAQAPPPNLPDNVVTTYGMTETASGVFYNSYPLDGVGAKVDGNSQIWLKAPMIAEFFRDGTPVCDKDGWLHTSDLGAFAPDGRLEVFGRASDVIHSGGEKIFPIQLEKTIQSLESVDEVAVVGVADERWGEAVIAFIVAKDPSAPPTLAQVRASVMKSHPPWYAPKDLRIISAIPKTSMGKIRRDTLREVLSQHPS